MTATDADVANFVRGYLTCALWSSTDNATDSGGEPLDSNYYVYDLSPGSTQGAKDECLDFLKANEKDIAEYVSRVPVFPGSTAWDMAGHDFWLTRNRHGAGFWDRGLNELGDRLTEAARAYGESDIYVGDDDRLYIAGYETSTAK